ncbi:amidohydrolase family protein [Thalassotalea sp. PLHSN55]|uniref:amidohydrolase family protein n=1 Tax=Thalassotalea sp. PLHSN55 TaxID=3435888 RepID=UPI003F8398B9
MKIIDPHLHLFNLEQGEYAWLYNDNISFNGDKRIIVQNFNEQDLHLTTPLQLAGFVHIEAGFNNKQPWQELNWLNQHCQLPYRSIAFIDLTLAPKPFNQQLKQLSAFNSFVGIRHILDEDALDILNHQYCQQNLIALNEQKLIVELQLSLQDSAAVDRLIALAQQLPALTFIINHAGWPPNEDEETSVSVNESEGNAEFALWQSNLKRMSTIKQCAIKCSGWEMMTNSKVALSLPISVDKYDKLTANIVAECLNAFGENRVMLASNFPLCLFRQSFQQLWQSYQQLPLSAEQLTKLTFANAANWYRLNELAS